MNGEVVRTISRRFAPVLVMFAFVAICVGPHLHRLGHPSLFTDYIARISDLRSRPMQAVMLRPFQEHMAPLFAIVSWAAWQAAGQRLTSAPLAYTVASYVAVAAYGVSSLHAEAIYWYSASSFFWALFWTLLVLDGAGTAVRTGKRSSLAWSAIAATVAPAFSGIGLLAGPLGAIRVAASVDVEKAGEVRIARFASIVPFLGTLLYLGIGSMHGYLKILAPSLEHRADFSSGLIYAF